MNLVQTITDQALSGGFGKLTSLLGGNEAKTESAVGAAVPALLSGFSSLASTDEGAQKLTSALGKFDAGSLESLGHMLSAQPEAAADKGSSLLSSLFSGNMLSGLVSTLSRFTGLGIGSVKTLLGYLSPLVLGTIAKQFVGKTINAQGLTSLFASQKTNITNAMPSGFSLADVPGLATVRSAAGAAYSTAKDTARAGYQTTKQAGTSARKWLIPTLGLAALAFLLYSYWPSPKPETKPGTTTSLRVPTAPDVASVTNDLTGTFTSLTSTLASLKDPASVAAAIPKLTEMTGKLDSVKAMVDKLPEAGQRQVAVLIKSSTGKLGDQFTHALMIPGVSDSLRPALEGIGNKVSALGGMPAGQLALPSVEVTKLGGEISGMLASLTTTLSGIKDTASANAAIPKLQEINAQLDLSKGAWEKLPSGAKTAIGSMVAPSLTKLKTQVTEVLALNGASDKVKSDIDQIMSKLTSLIG